MGLEGGCNIKRFTDLPTSPGRHFGRHMGLQGLKYQTIYRSTDQLGVGREARTPMACTLAPTRLLYDNRQGDSLIPILSNRGPLIRVSASKLALSQSRAPRETAK